MGSKSAPAPAPAPAAAPTPVAQQLPETKDSSDADRRVAARGTEQRGAANLMEGGGSADPMGTSPRRQLSGGSTLMN